MNESETTPPGSVPLTITSGAAAAEIRDCWSKIGVVGGDRTCAELEKYVHCRNCPVYAAAGAQLLNRELPQGYRAEWTEHFAAKKKSGALGKISLLIFRIGEEWLGLPTVVFQELAERRPGHSLPHRKRGIILGLINVRGELLVCVSLACLLGAEGELGCPRQFYERVLVLNWEGNRFAFPVNEVHGVHRFKPDDLKTSPTANAKGLTFIRGILSWQGKTVGCIDEDLLFSTLNRSLT